MVLTAVFQAKFRVDKSQNLYTISLVLSKALLSVRYQMSYSLKIALFHFESNCKGKNDYIGQIATALV